MEEQTEQTEQTVELPPAGALDPNDELLRRIDELADENTKFLTAIRELNTTKEELQRLLREQDDKVFNYAARLDEARNIVAGIQYNMQVVLSALVLERQYPTLLNGDPLGRNNHLCAILAQTLDAFPHLFQHLEGQPHAD